MPTGFFRFFFFFRPKKFIFHIHFKTWPLQSIPIIRSSLLRATKKVSLNPYRIRIFFLVSFLFNWIVHTLLQFLIPSKTITEFRPKWAKSLCPFSNQIGAPPPPHPVGVAHWHIPYMVSEGVGHWEIGTKGRRIFPF